MKSERCSVGLMVAALVMLTGAAWGTEYFVTTTGSDAGAGTSWGTAFATISNAVARGDATIVTVSNGTYTIAGQIIVGKAVTIRSYEGGVYGGIPNASNTIVQGNGGVFRIFGVTNANAVVDGFTIRRGTGRGDRPANALSSGWNGTGIYMPNGGTVRNCIIKENGSLWSDGSYLFGGGVYMGAGVLSNCVVRNNRTDQRGGGGGVYATGGLIVDCQVLSNTNNGGYSDGGGIYAQDAEVRNCLVASNAGYSGHGNPKGGGIYLDNGSIESCTVVNNSSQDGAGGAHIVNGGTMRNSIAYFNTVSGTTNNLNTTAGVSYSCSVASGTTANGCIMGDPLFEDVAAGDYQLMVSPSRSPCINAADNSGVTWGTDLVGNRRISGGSLDMGAFEFPFPGGTVLVVR